MDATPLISNSYILDLTTETDLSGVEIKSLVTLLALHFPSCETFLVVKHYILVLWLHCPKNKFMYI